MTDTITTITKDGELVNIDTDNLRVDDVVVLQTADIVPADLKLVEANGLEVDEFDITGELLPVIKEVGEEAVILYAGSKVTRGTGKGIVIAVGEETEYGRIVNQVWEQEQPDRSRVIESRYLWLVILLLPPLIVQVTQVTNVVVVIAFHLLLAFLLGVLQNDNLFKKNLVAGERRKLEESKIQIRDVKALERMGGMDILCLDKTGVLTTRQMEVKNIYLGDRLIAATSTSIKDSDAWHWVKTACALCNDVSFWEKIGQANPVDKALISFALKEGMDVRDLFLRARRIYDKPFDSENRYMACGFELDGGRQYFAKGDPAVIQRRCNQYLTAAGERKRMDNDFWNVNLSNMQAINQSGDTVIGLAFMTDAADKEPRQFTFLCLLQLENPLHAGAREIVHRAKEKGIRSILLTGDRAETAGRIAEQCGMTTDPAMVLTGGSIARMELREVARQSAYCSVYARLIPSQKGTLVRLLRERGHCVGMVGDGINDGIALKAADIGISFTENSSPIAQRLAHILINKLDDLTLLVESADRIKNRIGQLRIIRIGLMAVSLISVYAWAFAPTTFGR